MGHKATSSYPAGSNPAAAQKALARMAQRLDAAEAAYDMVTYQAIRVCLDEGMSIRQTAGHLRLSKSEVGRIAKELRTGPKAWALSPGDAVESLIQASWGAASM